MPSASSAASRSAEPPRPATSVERVAVAEERAELAQRLGEERHELVVARLAEHVGELVGAHARAARRSTTAPCARKRSASAQATVK